MAGGRGSDESRKAETACGFGSRQPDRVKRGDANAKIKRSSITSTGNRRRELEAGGGRKAWV